jgi:hypothetical protein
MRHASSPFPGRRAAASVSGHVVLAAVASSASLASIASAGDSPFSPRLGWPITGLTNSSVDGGVMVNLDADPELELIQVVGPVVHGLNLDGTPAAGWPRTMSELGTFSAPAVGDIDGDKQLEIVVNSFFFGIGGRTYAYELDGTTVPGWPRDLGGNLKAPALGDVDGDGDDDVIVVVNQSGVGTVHVLGDDGTALPGWPRSFQSITGTGPCIGDVDGDGDPEIFAASFDRLYGFDHTGTTLPGFPWDPGPSFNFNYTTPVLADMDGDGDREILIGASDGQQQNSRFYVLDHDGSVRPGWPRPIDWGLYVPASVADVDGDGSLDVVVGDQALSPDPVNQIYAWNASGQSLDGFPYGPINAITAQIIIVDVDGDGFVELLYDDNCAQCDLQGINHDGTPLEAFPLVVDGSSFQQSPVLGDFDGNGTLDMAASGNFLQQGTTSLYQFTSSVAWNPALAPVRMYQYDEKRSGVVPQPAPVACPADLDRTGTVDFDDVLLILAGFGGPNADVDGDGVTAFSDLLAVLAAWGDCI